MIVDVVRRILIALGHEGQTDPYESARGKDVTGYTENGWTVQLDIDRELESLI